MKNSENSRITSMSDPVQLPLKGFKMSYGNPDEKWVRYIEGMGEGRYRIHSTKKTAHKAI